jgi:HlyD family secretion protein
MTVRFSGRWVLAIALLILAAGGVFAWQYLHKPAAVESFASGNGRIEATEVNISTKQPGRLKEILVQEGDDVQVGQVVARMDTATLEAGLHQAEAQIRQAKHSQTIATTGVAQRQNEVSAAKALVDQRESQLALAEKEIQRTQQLVDKGFVSPQKLDIDKNNWQSAAAAASAAKSQLLEAESAVEAARAGVMAAQSAADVAAAGVEKIKEDLRDATLISPINGRVLYRMVEPREVLGAGGNIMTLLDITDVYMTIFLPTSQAGRVSIGADARIVLDVRPDISIPAKVTFVSPEAQFTPKSVETRTEREKLMFRIKVKIPQELLITHAKQVKTGLPGVAYVQLVPDATWPATVPPLVTSQKTR